MAIRSMHEKQKPIEPLTDLSPMPYGKYKGLPMQDVPASYLHYLWEHGVDGIVAEYIGKSLEGLRMENPDLIWKHRRK